MRSVMRWAGSRPTGCITELVGLPTTPGAMGVDASVIEKAAARAMRDLTTMTNPRPPERADYAEIIRQAL